MYYSNFEYNDCIGKGACSVSPNVSSMQEVMYILLRQEAYYTIKLLEIGIRKDNIIRDIVTEIASLDLAKDLSESQILNAFSKQYINLVAVRKEYLKICNDKDVKSADLHNLLKFSPKTSLSMILRKGNKEFLSKYKKFNFEKKYSSEILKNVIKSLCINLINLYEYNKNSVSAENEILHALNLFNSSRAELKKIKSCIDSLAETNIKLLKIISCLQAEKYGEIEKVEVSFSTSPKKAIMVSGSDLEDLKLLLESVKGQEIDVYTNGNLLIAHAFPYFKNSANLKGHFGSPAFNTILDFATFPGSILLTKNEVQNIEYLYRGRLFSTEESVPKGVIKIKDNNFQPVIESALQAKGFAKGQHRNSADTGVNFNELEEIINKIASSDFDKIYILGFSNLSVNQKDYFQQFFKLMSGKSFVLSFSYNPETDNVYSINLANNYPLFGRVLAKIFEKIPVNSDKLVFFLTKCDVNSLSSIIYLKNSGAKNIFLSDCPPTVINPAVLRAFNKMFKINAISNPKDDLAKIKEEL